jgi:hypothetical protein
MVLSQTLLLFVYWIYIFSKYKVKPLIVRTSTGPDFSVRVPVVVSVYSAPPLVSLSVSPTDAVCEGSTIFTANGGADLFSIDGIIKQQMSANREFQTYVEKGQIVSVRTRYAVNLTENNRNGLWKRCY